MRKRALGKTGRIVSEMGLGTWGLSGDAYGPVPPEEAERVVRRAREIGITLFDTADAYGAGRMEQLLGKVVGKHHDDVTVVTKIGTDRSSSPVRKRFDADYLQQSLDRSLRRLACETVDVLLLHNPSSECLEHGDAMESLALFKKQGKLRHWGVAVGDAETAKLAMDAGAEVIELAYSLMHSIDLNRVAGEVMISGAGVLARSVLAYGMLGGDWTAERQFPEGDHRQQRWTQPELERRLVQVDAVRFLVNERVPSLRGAAVRFALAHSLVSTAVLGPRSVSQLEELVREAGGGPIYLPDNDLLRLPRALTRAGVLV